jgi:surface polysaccharide O-acyltransferase-like enzyme
MNETNPTKESENMAKPKRIFYYDVLRALAIIGIVFCHVSVSYVSRDINSPNLYISVFFDCFRDFSIPIFVMLSGALLIGKKDTLLKFFKKRLSRLFIPFLFWVLVYVAVIW